MEWMLGVRIPRLQSLDPLLAVGFVLFHQHFAAA
jgi:hypothetical protein